MRANYIYVLALLLATSCSHSTQTASLTTDYANFANYSYVTQAQTPSCSTGLTISGGLSARCN